jgi:hypothetical protein
MKNLVDAQEYMLSHDIDGWLTRDYRYTNPVFWQAYENMCRTSPGRSG